MVAISYNSDIGDAWEMPTIRAIRKSFAGLPIRIGVNYVVYSMTIDVASHVSGFYRRSSVAFRLRWFA